MSHFYADIQGNRGPASRCGSKNSGMASHTRGWNAGIRVHAEVDDLTGADHFYVYRTSGSNGCGPDRLVARVTYDPESDRTIAYNPTAEALANTLRAVLSGELKPHGAQEVLDAYDEQRMGKED